VCINPASLSIARELCTSTKTGICVVCDFPFGLSSTASKISQIHEICKNNDIEDLDVVANYGWIKSGLWKEVEFEFKAAAEAVHKYNTFIKVIFETDALTLDEVGKATEIACTTGIDFVKTSTGFFTGGETKGATVEVIQKMLDVSKGRCKIKGSGGIRDREHFLKLIDMGIDRMGIGYRSTPVVLGVKN
jgi:deoxyribose-phosphate aldolase